MTVDAPHLAPLTCLTRLSRLTHLTLPGTPADSRGALEAADAELVQLVGALAGGLPGAPARVHERRRPRAPAHRLTADARQACASWTSGRFGQTARRARAHAPR